MLHDNLELRHNIYAVQHIVDRAFAFGEPLCFALGDEVASEEHFGLGGGE